MVGRFFKAVVPDTIIFLFETLPNFIGDRVHAHNLPPSKQHQRFAPWRADDWPAQQRRKKARKR